MEPGSKDLLALRRAADIHSSLFLDLVQPEVGGRRFDLSLFSKIEANPGTLIL